VLKQGSVSFDGSQMKKRGGSRAWLGGRFVAPVTWSPAAAGGNAIPWASEEAPGRYCVGAYQHGEVV